MNKFLKKSFIFFSPLLVWGIIIILIDPFNYFRFSNLISEDLKINNVKSVNQLLFKSIEFKNSPNKYIIIGDSRSEILPKNEIESISGINYSSLSNNAAKLNEIIDLVYMANEINQLKHIVIGINFNMFNEYGYADRVSDVKKTLVNPLRYIYGKNTIQACYYIFKSLFFKKNIISEPPTSKEKFWDWNIKVKAMHWYGRYKYPTKLIKELQYLDTFCVEKDIKLTFLITPHHVEFHDRLVEFNLEEEEIKFKSFLSQLNATVIDYDYENEITISKKNFNDPIHYNSKIASLIVDEVWSGNLTIGKRLSK